MNKNKYYLKILDYVIVSWLFIYSLLQFRTHNIGVRVSGYCLCILMWSSVITKIVKTGLKIRPIHLIICIPAGLILFYSIFRAGPNVKDNLAVFLKVITIYCYLANLCNYNGFLDEFFKKALPILNCFLLINAVFMLLQVFIPYFYMDTNSTTTFYKDHITGFLGANGTHKVTLFTAFVALLNCHYLKAFEDKNKIINLVIFIIGLVLSFYISTQNDNVSFFVFVPGITIAYYLLDLTDNKKLLKNLLKIAAICIVAIVVIFVVMSSTVPAFADITSRLRGTVFNYSIQNGKIVSTDERARLTVLAFSEGGLFGRGLGSIRLLADESVHVHFGMASIQSILYIFGLVFYLLMQLVIAVIYQGEKANVYVTVIVLIVLTAASYYTVIYTDFIHAIFMALICTVLCKKNNPVEKSTATAV